MDLPAMAKWMAAQPGPGAGAPLAPIDFVLLMQLESVTGQANVTWVPACAQ
jgi:hypothetical protein